MELRGFDHYEVTLGDEVRGHRATMGKSLEDAEADLRIRHDLLLAIENCDVSGFPNPSVVAGYVRSYGRYLGFDPDVFYARFCEESGFVPPSHGFGHGGGGRGQGARGGAKRLEGSPFDNSRFATPPAQTRFATRISLGAVVSVLSLVALVGALGYGGYALLQNMQRVGFAPLPEAPEVVAEAPSLVVSPAAADTAAGPSLDAYDRHGALAAVYAPDDQPPVLDRDGPISAIDPGETNPFRDHPGARRTRVAEAEPADAADARIDSADDAIRAARASERRRVAEELLMARRLAALETEVSPVEPEGPPRIAVHAADRAWIRVRNADRAIVFEGILEAGESYELPERLRRGSLRAGNAGGVFILVGETAHGPLGGSGEVVKNISLAPADVRGSYPDAGAATMLVAGDAPAGRRAEAADAN